VSDPLIAVTGASGAVGSRVVARLAQAGSRLRLVVRDPERAPRIAGAEVCRASDYGAREEMRAALAGVDLLFLIPAAESADRVAGHRAAVDAAVAAGVGHVVYLSFLGAAPDATFTLARDHWATEEHVRASGLAHTFLRMSLYMDFLPAMVAPDGMIRGPAGDGRVAAILRDDVAAAAAAVLLSGGRDGETFDLTGPEAFTLAEAAEWMAAPSGRAVRFLDESDAEAYESRRSYGAPGWQLDAWVSTYQAIRDGSLQAVSPCVRELTGRDPVSLAEHLRAHPESLGHVVA
jgi:uncharacterized protein YbjT (DUF2867 family)